MDSIYFNGVRYDLTTMSRDTLKALYRELETASVEYIDKEALAAIDRYLSLVDACIARIDTRNNSAA